VTLQTVNPAQSRRKGPELLCSSAVSNDFDEHSTFAMPLGTPSQLVLKIIGEGILHTYPVPETGVLTVGRSSACTVHVDHVSVSRQHVSITRRGGKLFVEDLGSRNGTRVRQRALAPQAATEIAVGELIEVGTLLLVVQPGAATESAGERRRAFVAELDRRCRGNAPFALATVKVSASLPNGTVEDLVASALGDGDSAACSGPGICELCLDGDPASAPARARAVAARLLEHGMIAEVGVAVFPADGRDHAALSTAARRGTTGVVPTGVEGAMERLAHIVDRIAPSDIAILITGETGVGKEVMTEKIAARSRRATQPLLRLNCGALSESLLESELFGHEKGSFTGAMQAKPGLLETADGGTVFLDEIGDLPMSLQVKLLRVLEDGIVRRVGSLKGRTIDVRFVAATHRDLEAECAAGRFRRDLYFRLNGITLHIPPLRERQAEIPALAQFFINEIARKNAITPVPRLDAEVQSWLQSHDWPGNIRELRNTVERATLLASASSDGVIRKDHLAIAGAAGAAVTVPPPPATSDDARQQIVDALTTYAGNQTRAAKALGISRQTLIERIKKHDVPRPRKR